MTRIDADGTLSAQNGAWVLRFERRLSHPAETIWDALTEPEAMGHWFPQEVSGDLSPGGKLRFEFRKGDTDGSVPGFDGEVLEYDPPRVLAFTWGPDLLRWELHPDGDGCRMIFTDTITEQGKAARDGAGWHVCLDHLEAWLDGSQPPPPGHWKAVHPGYVASFGPEAATMGPPNVG